jgi:hypothetical protein
MFTPGGPALSYAEVLDYVLRSKAGKGISVPAMLGTFSDPRKQREYIFNSPAMQTFEEFDEVLKRVMGVMNRHVYQLEGLLSQVQTYTKETEGLLGESAVAGKKVSYDRDLKQIYIDQGAKAAFEDSLREFALARTSKERDRYRMELTESMDRAHKLIQIGAAYKTIDVGEGRKAERLRSVIESVADPSSR